jgi:hypothetical protein
MLLMLGTFGKMPCYAFIENRMLFMLFMPFPKIKIIFLERSGEGHFFQSASHGLTPEMLVSAFYAFDGP